MELPKQLLTVASLGTLTGLITFTYISTNVIAQAFGLKQRWIGLAVALFWVEAAVFISGKATLVDYLIGLGNAGLVYLASVGAASGVQHELRASKDRTVQPQSAAPPPGRSFAADLKFFAAWF